MITSNTGHALWGRLASPERARLIATRLARQDLMTEFGLRTLSSADQFFEPTAYHRGTIWPFNNAAVAIGLLAYGFVDEATDIACRVVHALELIGGPIELYAVLPSVSQIVRHGRDEGGHDLLFHRTPRRSTGSKRSRPRH